MSEQAKGPRVKLLHIILKTKRNRFVNKVSRSEFSFSC